MTENVRKRVSKWDLASETHFPPATGEMDVQLAIAGETSGDESKMDLKSLEDAGTEFLEWSGAEENKKSSKWLDLEAENATFMNSGTEGSHVSKWSDIKIDAKDCLKGSHCQPASRRDEWRAIDVSLESTGLATNPDQSMSPNIDARHQQNPSISPKGGWNRSHRRTSMSMSRSRSRSRSQSRDYDREIRDRGREWGWGGNRSRSRSPVHGFKRDGGGWEQTGTGAPCRDFVAGRCKRGGECRYLHEDGGRRFSSRHHDAVELGGSKHERGQSPGYHSREQTTDSMGQRDDPHEKAPPSHSSHYGGDWRKPEPHKSGKDNTICHDFRRGRCQRGSACRYMHHDTSSDGGWDGKGWPRDRFQDGGDIKESAFSDRRPELRRSSDIPCKFFAEGRCRNGDKCRFSHQEVQSQPDGRSCDLKSVQNSDNQQRMRWNGPTWDNQDGSVVASNALVWQKDDSSSKAAPYATVGLESDPDRYDQRLKHAEAGKEYMLPMGVSQTDLPAQDQSSSRETSSQQQRMRWNRPTWDNQDGSVVASNAPVWQKDDSSSKAARYATVGLESDPDRHDQQLKHAEAGKEYMLPMGVSQTDLPAQDQSSSQETSSRQQRMRWNGPTWDNQDGSVVASNAPVWQKDDSSSKAASYATVGLESDPDRHDQQLKHAEAGKEYMLPTGVSQTDFPAQDLSSSLETSSRHEHVSEFSALPVSQNVFGQQHAGVDRRDGSPRDNDSIVINTSITKNEVSHEEETISVSNSICLNEAKFVNLPANPAVTGQSSSLIGQSQYVIPLPYNVQSFNLTGQSQPVVTPAHFDGKNQSLLLNGQTRVIVPQNAPNMHVFDISQSHQIPPPFFNVQTPQSSRLLLSNRQCQLTAPQPSQNVNYTMETQSQRNPPQSMNLNHQAQVDQEGQLQGADNDAMKPSATMSDTITSRGVTSEPVAQLSSLPASLSQVFGNGPQLPQLYAALNPQHGAGVPQTFSHPGSVSSFASTAATNIQPNQGSWTQQRQGPASNMTDLGKVEISNNPLGLPSDTCGERSMDVGEPQSLLKTIAPLQSTDGAMKTVGSESNPHTKQVDANGDNELKEKVAVAHSKDPNVNVQADGVSKTNKDAKETRLFRFVLVEFVKDILRPTWKEGQMSKEAHKTIVKKVVDKVTGTLDGNIPQTQERIDLYLSYSKEKLTKLVQAYTEKYLKT